MSIRYIGHLAAHDPLHDYLHYDILPQFGRKSQRSTFRVFRMGGSNEVYLYQEKQSQLQIVGKFFHQHGGNGMEREFHNLCLLRSYGLENSPHYVVRPLGYNGWLNSLLVEEYCQGHSLGDFILAAIFRGQREALYKKLTALAYFLATQHNRTANGYGVNFDEDCSYLDHIVHRLAWKQAIRPEEVDEFFWLRDRWREQSRMWEDQQVLVHGDATPSNFLFGHGIEVIAIDLENMKRADRVFDVGRIAGELQHFFLQHTGNKYEAEPFVGHFLWEYACHFPDRYSAFHSICNRVPYQMGLTLLRIARNSWVSDGYRRQLIEEAKNTLRDYWKTV
ncbi:MAG TPA: aminoglycoside phosphotransferase family protein [Ktedonobacteraceae bacterium]|nr:aminoglycoside phosphotransferase family protein [Ktedonobacteraceae bacterium]